MLTPTKSNDSKSGSRWDTRTWTVGLITSIAAASVAVWGISSSIRALHPGIIGAAILFALLIIPPILVGLCRRRWLLWAYLPVFTLFLEIVTYAVSLAGRGDFSSGDGTDAGGASMTAHEVLWMTALLLLPLITALPVVMIRAIRTRRIRHQMEVTEVN